MTEIATNTAEAVAKAKLLNHLRRNGYFSTQSVVTTELVLDKQAVRADIVLTSRSMIHCFEIKTKVDNLSRLDNQVCVYARHADYVTVVADTKHVNAVLSRVPVYVGVYELSSFCEMRIVREPARSPVIDPDAMLSVLPVSVLRERLMIKAARREDVLFAARAISSDRKKAVVIEFVRERYAPTTRALLSAARRRAIQPEDLSHLKRWRRLCPTQPKMPVANEFTSSLNEDDRLFREIGSSFGPVPDEIRLLLGY